MKYIEIGQNFEGVMIYGRVDEDGLIRVTCIAENPEYQAYLNKDTLPSNFVGIGNAPADPTA